MDKNDAVKKRAFTFMISKRQVSLELEIDDSSIRLGLSALLLERETLLAEELYVCVMSDKNRSYNCVQRLDATILPELCLGITHAAFWAGEFQPSGSDESPKTVTVSILDDQFQIDLDDDLHEAPAPEDFPSHFPGESKGEKDIRKDSGDTDKEDIEKCCVKYFHVNSYAKGACLHLRWYDRLPNGDIRLLASVRGFAAIYAQFDDQGACKCRCCEYRQYIKGGFWIRVSANAKWIPIPYPLGAGVLSVDKFQEDVVEGRRVGHREDEQALNDLYMSPDRATGCFYIGTDQPGIQGIEQGVHYKIDLKFMSYITDTCRELTEKKNVKEWKVSCEGIS